jgi:hypothetical protein
LSLVRGSVFASALTDPNGAYQIKGLEQGSYVLQVEPFLTDGSSLSQFFKDMNVGVCGGKKFARTWYRNGNDLKVFTVKTPGQINVGELGVECAISVAPLAPYPNLSTVTSISSSSGVPLAIIDRLDGGTSRRYSLQHSGGILKVQVISSVAYSAVETSVRIFSGNQDVTSSLGSGLPAGTYDIQIGFKYASIWAMPGGRLAIDSSAFYILMVSGETTTEPGDCAMTDTFPAYQSPPGNPERQWLGKGGGCAPSAQAAEGGKPQPDWSSWRGSSGFELLLLFCFRFVLIQFLKRFTVKA